MFIERKCVFKFLFLLLKYNLGKATTNLIIYTNIYERIVIEFVYLSYYYSIIKKIYFIFSNIKFYNWVYKIFYTLNFYFIVFNYI